MAETTPVADHIIPPNPMATINSLSGILNLRQQQQALQTGQYQQQSAQATAQQDQQKNSELQALARFSASAMKDPKYQLPDGSLDVQKFQNDAMAVAPTYGQPIIGQTTSNVKEGINTRAAIQSLSAAQNAQIAAGLKGLASIPGGATKSQILDWKNQMESNNKDPAFARALDNALLFMQPDPNGGYSGAAAKMAAALGGMSMQEPGTVDLGTSVQPTVTTTMGPNVGQQTPAGGSFPKSGIIQLANGQAARLNQATGKYELIQQGNTQGGATPTPAAPPHPRTAQDDAPPPNAPKAVQDQYQTAVTQANTHVENVRTADHDYGLNTKIADRIRELSKNTTTGTGSQTLQNIGGVLGLPFNGNVNSDYQTLGAYLDRQAATLRGVMGLPATNEGVATSQTISGNTGYSQKALQEKNDLNQALTEGVHQYRRGMDAVAGFGGQASPKSVNAFKSAWADAFDPNVYIGELAYKRSKKDGDDFVATLDPAEAASLKAKRARLAALAKGQLQ
jgi:hypothetical protein